MQRPQATTRDGTPQYSITYPKAKNGGHSLREVKVECTYGKFGLKSIILQCSKANFIRSNWCSWWPEVKVCNLEDYILSLYIYWNNDVTLRGNECLLVDKWTKWKRIDVFFQSTAIIFSKFDWYHDNRQWFWCMYPVKLYQNLLLKMMARRTKCNNVLEI